MNLRRKTDIRTALPRQQTFAAIRAIVCIMLIGLVALLQLRAVSLERSLLVASENINQRARTAAQYLSLLQDVETGQRGFVVTGNPKFLQPYEEAMRLLPTTGRQLRANYPGGTAESIIASDLLRTGQDKIAYTNDVIRVRKYNASKASAIVGAGYGKQLMDHARSLIANIEQRDSMQSRALLEEGSRQRAAQQREILAAELALLVSAASVALALSGTIRRLEKTGRSLSDSATRQTAIFEGASDAMLLLDHQGSIVSLNGATERLFGTTKAALIGQSNLVLFADPPSEAQSRSYLRALDARDDRAKSVQTFVGRRADDSQFETEVVTTPIRLHDALHFLAVTRDVTERSRIERMKTEFVATVSHELRTPLTSIAGSLGLLVGGAGGILNDKARRLIEIALNNSHRLIRLINDMLDIEKIESGKMVFDPKRLGLSTLLADVIEANIGFAQKNQVRISLATVPSNAAILADRDRIVQVFTNLLSNAVKFSSAGSSVLVTARQHNDRWRISVTDRGVGIPQDFQKLIFGKFAQADSTDTRLIGGSGLGLSIVKEIVERSGGDVSFTTEEGKGSTFHVDLPASDATFGTDGAAPVPSRLTQHGLPHLLHVEDDVDTLRVVADLLEGQLDVQSTPSLREADAALRRFRFDAVLLDLSLEDGRGVDLVPLIRASNPRASIFVFTAYDMPPADRTQFDAVFIKSRIDLTALALRLRQLIDAKAIKDDAA